MCHRAECQLDCQADSVRAGRYFVVDTLAGWGLDADGPAARTRDDILLVATELLSNAVKAATDRSLSASTATVTRSISRFATTTGPLPRPKT